MSANQSPDSRRRALLEAALDAFAEGGFEGTTTTQVAARANLSQPRIIQIFGTKDALMVEAYNFAMQEALNTIRGALVSSDHPDRVGYVWLELIKSRPSIAKALLYGLAVGPNSAIYTSVQQSVIELLEFFANDLKATREETYVLIGQALISMLATSLDLGTVAQGKRDVLDFMDYVWSTPNPPMLLERDSSGDSPSTTVTGPTGAHSGAA